MRLLEKGVCQNFGTKLFAILIKGGFNTAIDENPFSFLRSVRWRDSVKDFAHDINRQLRPQLTLRN